MTMDFKYDLNETVVKWYDTDSDEDYQELKFYNGSGRKMGLYYEEDDDGETQRIYVYYGTYKVSSGNIIFTATSKMDPNDPTGDPIEVEEVYTFMLVDENLKPVLKQKSA